LGAALRLNGDPITGGQVCAPLVAGITPPTQNVAMAGALAVDAVQTSAATAPATQPWYQRVLGLGSPLTQLSATIAQQPTIVSVELGANEVLNATSGLIAPFVTVAPLPAFTQPYDFLLYQLAQTHAKVILVGLPSDGSKLPSLRKGWEIWNDRAEFAALHVDVSGDCQNNQNYINVSQLSLTMVFTAAQTFAHGLPNPVYSCTDIPGQQDLILTPADMVTLNMMLGAETDHIKQQAQLYGFGYFSLGALYDRSDLKAAPYSIIAQLTSRTPYSPYISLDGVHPSAMGSAVIAAAGAQAYNQAVWGHGISPRGALANVRTPTEALSFADQVQEPELPAVALAQAQRIVAANAGRKISGCVMPATGLSGC
jgi:hypothetical protein